jgi:Phytanoyl-CoA dioxygenase (PhyH)
MITVDKARSFQTDGYLILPDLVAEPILAQLREEAANLLDRFVAEMDATGETDPRVTWWRLPSGEPYLFKIKPVFDLAPTARELGHSPELIATAAELLGGQPRLMEEKITYKQRVSVTREWASLRMLGEEVHKHTDAAYFHARGFHDPILTLAVCLDDAPIASGAVRVWPGTHKQHLPHVPTKDHGPVVPDASAPDWASMTLAAKAGSVLAWDARLVHASGPNTTEYPRRLLVLGYTRATPGAR